MRNQFTTLRWYAVRESYRVVAKFVSYHQPQKIAIPNILGQTEYEPSPGYATFQLMGHNYRLDPVLEGDQLFFIFRDQTSGKDYLRGRPVSLYGPAEGRQGGARLRQSVRPSLRFHSVCNLPAASQTEPPGGEDRGRRNELWQSLGAGDCLRRRSADRWRGNP